jgi:SsrA-binding protein
MHIDPYSHGTYNNHFPKASRKLLLKKRELQKLFREVSQKGMAIVPLSLFINATGKAKIEIALAKGKKNFDKRETLKDRENQRDLDRIKKQHNK